MRTTLQCKIVVAFPMPVSRDALLTQLRKGLLEYCVLALLRSGPFYGVELSARLARREVLFTNEGTLYPLLSRLRKQEWVETFWRESTSGPPRRYYQLTSEGVEALKAFTQVWGPLNADVQAVLEEQA